MRTRVPILGRLGACATVALLATSTRAAVLYDNGPIVTDPSGGTGSISGLPISRADPFTIPGSSFGFSTTGIGATVSQNTSVAENFTVPAGATWDLSAVTLFAYQTSQTTPSISAIRINLWTAAPFNSGSPDNVPDPLPQPVLATALTIPAGPGSFTCHRQSPTSTATVRPVFAYTVALDGLPDGGLLSAGTYWLEWSFDGALTPSPTVFTPLVSPREHAPDWNARQFNALDGQPASPRVWFEGREGYVAGVADGRGFALPFILHGSAVPTPGSGLVVLVGAAFLRRSRRAARTMAHRSTRSSGSEER